MLAQYDSLAAANLVRTYLGDHPDDRPARLQLTFLGLQCERQEWVTTIFGDPPEPSTMRPATVVRMVLAVLHQERCGLEAPRFSCGQLRAYPSDPDARHVYISLFMLFDPRGRPLSADVVARDVAVCAREVGKVATEWLAAGADRPKRPASTPRTTRIVRGFEWARTVRAMPIGNH